MPGMYESDQPLKVAELGDTIFIAESEKTPFSRMLRRASRVPNQMLAQWPAQNYPDRAFGGTVDGTDLDTFENTTRGTIQAYGQWMLTEGWMVSKLANVTRAAGVGRNERGKQAADDALILARMIEKQLLSADDTQLEAKPATAYQSRGVFSWLATSAQSTLPVPADFRPSSSCVYSSALASFKPSNMVTMLEAASDAKKGPVDLMGYVGIKLKRQMTTWSEKDTAVSSSIQNLQAFNIDQREKRLIQVVDFFEFDAGMVRTIPSWFLYCTQATGAASDYTSRSGVFLDLKMWEIGFFQQPSSWIEPPKSGGPRGYHDAIYILKCLNPLGQCMVATSS